MRLKQEIFEEKLLIEIIRAFHDIRFDQPLYKEVLAEIDSDVKRWMLDIDTSMLTFYAWRLGIFQKSLLRTAGLV